MIFAECLDLRWKRWPGELRLQARLGSELVGFVSLTPWRKRVRMVWVREDLRRRGIATALYDELATRYPNFRHDWASTDEGSDFLRSWQR